jgi:hypothetical protein
MSNPGHALLNSFAYPHGYLSSIDAGNANDARDIIENLYKEFGEADGVRLLQILVRECVVDTFARKPSLSRSGSTLAACIQDRIAAIPEVVERQSKLGRVPFPKKSDVEEYFGDHAVQKLEAIDMTKVAKCGEESSDELTPKEVADTVVDNLDQMWTDALHRQSHAAGAESGGNVDEGLGVSNESDIDVNESSTSSSMSSSSSSSTQRDSDSDKGWYPHHTDHVPNACLHDSSNSITCTIPQVQVLQESKDERDSKSPVRPATLKTSPKRTRKSKGQTNGRRERKCGSVTLGAMVADLLGVDASMPEDTDMVGVGVDAPLPSKHVAANGNIQPAGVSREKTARSNKLKDLIDKSVSKGRMKTPKSRMKAAISETKKSKSASPTKRAGVTVSTVCMLCDIDWHLLEIKKTIHMCMYIYATVCTFTCMYVCLYVAYVYESRCHMMFLMRRPARIPSPRRR